MDSASLLPLSESLITPCSTGPSQEESYIRRVEPIVSDEEANEAENACGFGRFGGRVK